MVRFAVDFDAPGDGDYLVHLKDIGNLWPASLTACYSRRNPDFTLVHPLTSNIPQDARAGDGLRRSLPGYKGLLKSKLKVCQGRGCDKAEISAEEDSTVVVMDIRDECRVTS